MRFENSKSINLSLLINILKTYYNYENSYDLLIKLDVNIGVLDKLSTDINGCYLKTDYGKFILLKENLEEIDKNMVLTSFLGYILLCEEVTCVFLNNDNKCVLYNENYNKSIFNEKYDNYIKNFVSFFE